MANIIKPKRSYTASSVPAATSAGEMAVNVTDGKIWVTNAAGTSQVLVSSLAFSDHTGTVSNAQLSTTAVTAGSYTNSSITVNAQGRITAASSGAASGTVTSVAMTVPTGLSVSGSPITTSGTLALTLTAGYSIPTTSDQTNWGTAYTNRITSLTTTGSSGAASLSSNTLNIPTYTLAGLGGIKLADLSSSATGLTYTNTTGVFSLTAGYSIPTTASQTNWDSAYTQRLQWDGGSTSLVAATGRTSLGLVIGTNVQAWDGDLDAIAAITGTTGILKKTSANTWSLDTATYLTGNQTITLSGDVTGSGSTAITTTLATVSIAKGGTGQTTANAGLNALLPSQTSNSGKYLTSNGTDTSWGAVTGGPSFTASATAPASPVAGDRWYDTNTGSYLIYLDDGTSSQWVETSNSGMVSNPTGTIIPFAGVNAPSGFLLCNGATVSSSDYLALHSVISNTYGGSAYTGAAALNFTLPDYRGRVLIGAGTGSGLTARTLGGTVGAESHTVSSSNISQFSTGNAGSHTHSFSKEVLTYVGSGGNRYDPYPGSVWAGHIAAGLTLDTKPDHTHTVGTASPTAISNLQPSIGVNYLIKT